MGRQVRTAAAHQVPHDCREPLHQSLLAGSERYDAPGRRSGLCQCPPRTQKRRGCRVLVWRRFGSSFVQVRRLRASWSANQAVQGCPPKQANFKVEVAGPRRQVKVARPRSRSKRRQAAKAVFQVKVTGRQRSLEVTRQRRRSLEPRSKAPPLDLQVSFQVEVQRRFEVKIKVFRQQGF